MSVCDARAAQELAGIARGTLGFERAHAQRTATDKKARLITVPWRTAVTSRAGQSNPSTRMRACSSAADADEVNHPIFFER